MTDVIKELLVKYPTDEAVLEEIHTSRLENAQLFCPGCGTAEVVSRSTDRLVQFACGCRERVRLTAGTIFHGTRKPRILFIAMKLIESGIALSSSQFHEIFGCAQSTALMAQKKSHYSYRAAMRKSKYRRPYSRKSIFAAAN